jgi:hypothetical protein
MPIAARAAIGIKLDRASFMLRDLQLTGDVLNNTLILRVIGELFQLVGLSLIRLLRQSTLTSFPLPALPAPRKRSAIR